LLLVLSALIFALSNAADRIAPKEMNLYLYVSMSFILPGVLTLCMMLYIEGRKTLKNTHLHITPIIVVGLLTAIAATAQVISTTIAPTMGQVVYISQLKTIIVIFLAAIFLRERKHLVIKIFAAVLCTIGLILLK
jgi:drug/metabolite transporter (DMT)-like permease